jgi:Coenzyme PQQ synthesis protein D (PqqD)
VTSARYARNERVAWQLIDGEAVLIDLVSGETLGLNDSGGWIWSQMDGRTAEEISAGLSAHFDVASSDASLDVSEFVELLAARGLVVAKDPSV